VQPACGLLRKVAQCPSMTGMAEYCISRIPSKNGPQPTDISKQLILLEEQWKEKKHAQ